MGLRVSIRVTVPKEVISQIGFQEAIARAQREKTAPELKRLFAKTVEGWENKPYWNQDQKVSSARISMAVSAGGPNADQYALVNNGASPHAIWPRSRNGFLRFQPGYQSATRPHILSSRSKQRFGGFVSARMVNHPGFEAREFDQAVADEYAPYFEQDMQDAIADWVKMSTPRR
jgi:hypothetical protein